MLERAEGLDGLIYYLLLYHWTLHRESLLTQRDLCMQMISNKAGVSHLGLTVKALKERLKLVKLVNRNGCGEFIAKTKLRELSHVGDFGTETITYTMVVYHVYGELKP